MFISSAAVNGIEFSDKNPILIEQKAYNRREYFMVQCWMLIPFQNVQLIQKLTALPAVNGA